MEAKCSFCGRENGDVNRFISGNNACICEDCIAICKDIIRADDTDEPLDSVYDSIYNPGKKKWHKEDFSTMPKPIEIHRMLDEYVIGQHSAKRILSVAVYNHYKRIFNTDSISDKKKKEKEKTKKGNKTELDSKSDTVTNVGNIGAENDVELNKSNILMIGPTGSGKTLLAETLARIIHVPFVVCDATTITEAGYIGEDVESILQKLLSSCDFDVKKAERGIVYIDEVDKVARRDTNNTSRKDATGEGVQQALLKIIEGKVATVPVEGGKKSSSEYIQMDTSNILFICGGMFDGLNKIVQSRVDNSSIGFKANVTDKTSISINDTLPAVETDDLIKFGLIPEFVGRLPVIAPLKELEISDLVEILKEPKNSIIKQYKKLFSLDKIDIEFTDEFLSEVAKKALEHKSGARSLRTIMEKILLDTMYTTPSMKNIDRIVLNDKVILENREPEIFLSSNQVCDKKRKQGKSRKQA